MQTEPTSPAKLTTVAVFPQNTFLENLAVRADDSILVTEIEPDVFYVNTSDPFTAHESFLHRLDLRDWHPGEPVHPETVLKFPRQAGGLNGSCLLAPGVLVLADSLAGLIWRVDL